MGKKETLVSSEKGTRTARILKTMLFLHKQFKLIKIFKKKHSKHRSESKDL